MFKSLQDLYEHLESIQTIKPDLNLSRQIANLRVAYKQQAKRMKCFQEQYIVDYLFDKGRPSPYKALYSSKELPHSELFTDNFQYLKQRAKESKNPIIKSKYNHILWAICSQDYKYAKIAIDSYTKVLKQFNYPLNKEEQFPFTKILQNALFLSTKINYNRTVLLDLVDEIISNQSCPDYEKTHIIEFVLESIKGIDKSHFENWATALEETLKNTSDFRGKEIILKTRIKLSQKLNKDEKLFFDKLASLYENQGNAIGNGDANEHGFIKYDFYLKAIKFYQKAGKKAKVDRVSVSLEQTKPLLKFYTTKFSEESEPLTQWLKSKREYIKKNIKEMGSDFIYAHLINSLDLLPEENLLEETNVESGIISVFNVMSFDINKNINDQMKKFDLNQYHVFVQNFTLNHLWVVFREGILSNNLNYKTALEYLNEKSWYSTPLETHTNGEVHEKFSWLELIAPSIACFLDELDFAIRYNSMSPQQFILPLDSLAIKFEGLLREFLRIAGEPTIEIKENKTEERISFDKLLSNEKLKQILPKKDLAFLKYLFTNKGLNLRNNVAHGFYKPSNYVPATLILLFTAILRFGNYKLESQNTNTK